MKKLLLVFPLCALLGVLPFTLGSCKDSKKEATESADTTDANERTDTIGEDTAMVVVDNTPESEIEKLMNEKPMPKAADELFDDFFFIFSNNRKVQRERIVWPLTVTNNGEQSVINENQWTMVRFYAEDGFYVMLLDDEKQTKLAKDTSITNVVVKHVDIPQNVLENYQFNRIDGQWRMTEIEKESLSDSKDANFLRFYQKFATDSLFCRESLAEKISFTGPADEYFEGEEDEVAIQTRDISPAEYAYWAPELLTDFYAVAYGQKDESSNKKIFIMRQPASSQECRLYFKRQGSRWMLYRLVE